MLRPQGTGLWLCLDGWGQTAGPDPLHSGSLTLTLGRHEATQRGQTGSRPALQAAVCDAYISRDCAASGHDCLAHLCPEHRPLPPHQRAVALLTSGSFWACLALGTEEGSDLSQPPGRHREPRTCPAAPEPRSTVAGPPAPPLHGPGWGHRSED